MIKWCNKCGGLYISGNDGERSFTGTPCRCRYTTITVEIIPDTPETADPIPSYRALLSRLEDDREVELEKEHDKEIGDFQNEVRNLVIKLSGAPDHLIDGKGSDAGWQEFTLAEIGQGFAFLKETMDRQHRLMVSAEKRGVEKGRESDRAQIETARDLLSRCPGIRTDETRGYWDEVQAFLGREAK